ncbi:MAG: HRDC domain-containing protein, partial [Hyphomicrobiales bacterium]
EREAQEQDVPRRRVLKDEAIQDIAQQAPESEAELDSLRSLHRGFSRSSRGRAVLEAVARGLKRDMSTVPRFERLEPLNSSETAILDLLRVLLKSAAARHGVAPKLLATGDDLERIVREKEADVPALKGWRRKLFGDDALRLKRGELALAIRDGQVTTVPDPKGASESARTAGMTVEAGAYQAVARSRPEDA